jgi:Terminase RNaseH-like domain
VSVFVTQIAWGEIPHLSKEAREALEKSFSPHERAARTQGIPALGAGVIYPVHESELIVEPFEIPKIWRHVFALDVGWNRTAALWGAHDSESDVLYLYSEHYRGEAEPAVHAQAIRARGTWIPGVIDPAARGRSQSDGSTLIDIYRGLGLNLTEANNRVGGDLGGIYEVWQRLSSGRIKVFRTLENFLQEYRIYRRDDKGKVVKTNDHLMDDLRYLVMSGIQIAAFRPMEQIRPMFRREAEREWDPRDALREREGLSA